MIRAVEPKMRKIPRRYRWHTWLCVWPRVLRLIERGHPQGRQYRVRLAIIERRYSRSQNCWLYRLPVWSVDQ